MSYVYTIEQPLTTLSLLVTGVGAALAADGAPCKRVVVTQGEVVWDECDCGQLALTFTRIFPSTSFPDEVVPRKQCESALIVADCQASVTRCAPAPDAQGRAPSPTALTAAAVRSARDAYVVRKSLTDQLCSLGDTMNDWTITDTQVVGPQGGCGGVVINFKLCWVSCLGC